MVDNVLRIVIFGGTGFVGQAIIDNLLKVKDYDVEIYALVRNKNSIKERPNLKIFQGNINNIPKEIFPKEPHVVIHFATKNIDKDGSGYETINVLGTKELLSKINSNTLGIIYGSSFSVYGQKKLVSVKEERKVKPETDLGISRSKAENLILEEMRIKNKNAVLLRPRFIISDNDKYTIKVLIKLYMKHLKISWGRQESSYIEVNDYANIIIKLAMKMMDYNFKVQTPVNIGYKKAVSYNEIYRIFRKVLGKKVQVVIPVNNFILSLIKVIGGKKMQAIITKLELAGFSHSMDVSLLESIIGDEIIEKDPLKIIEDLTIKNKG